MGRGRLQCGQRVTTTPKFRKSRQTCTQSNNISKNKQLNSVVVISALFVYLLGHWFNSHSSHFKFSTIKFFKLGNNKKFTGLRRTQSGLSPVESVQFGGLRRTLKLKFGLCHTNTFRNQWGSVKSSIWDRTNFSHTSSDLASICSTISSCNC